MPPRNTIFIVDERPLSRHALWRRLAGPGRSFRLFGDARSALAALEAENPALVIADLDLPDADGVALLGEVRRRRPQTLTVLVAGTETPVGARHALRDRIIDALVGRPVEMLDGVVRELLHESWSDGLPLAGYTAAHN
ncbi:MAG: response regulator [Deltaproteobacteria bacterium]|nr:response regulator [Deltaproteobacteria bacterium]